MNRENIINIINAAGIVAESRDIMKNGVMMNGVIMGEGTTRPTFYLNDLTGSDQEIADALINQYNNLETPDFDTEKLLSPDFIYQHAILCVAGKVEDNVVSKKWLDLKQYVRVEIDDESSYVIKKSMLDDLGLDERKLFDSARKNLKSQIEIKNLAAIIADMMGISKDEVPDNPMWCARRAGGNHSAGIIANKAILDEFCDEHGFDKIIVIPSSIHEILLVPASELGKEAADAMVKSVNEETVRDVDRLADHAYIYDRTERRMTV